MKNKANKSVVKIILGIICLIISLGALFLTACGIIVYFINVPEDVVHNENNYYKGKVLEIEITGRDGNVNLDEVYFRVQDENGDIHDAYILNEQNLNVLERNNFAFEYEGKELDCVFSNYGVNYVDDKYVVALTSADKEYLNYKVGKSYLVNELTNSDKTCIIIAIVFGLAFIIFFAFAIKGLKGKPRQKKTKEERKKRRSSRILGFIGGYLIFWGVGSGILVGIFAISGMFQVDINTIGQPNLCYESNISQIKVSDNDESTNDYQILVDDGVAVKFISDENCAIALDNDLIKDCHNGESVVCVYTLVGPYEDCAIISLYSENKTYLEKGMGTANLKQAYLELNNSAKFTTIAFGVMSPIALIVGIVFVVIYNRMKKKPIIEPEVDYLRYAE